MENHVTSLEMSKRLVEVGFKKDTEYLWIVHKEVDKPEYSNCILSIHRDKIIDYPKDFWNFYPAPLATEILEELPSGIKIIKCKKNLLYLVSMKEEKGIKGFQDKSLPNALALMYCYLTKEKII
jgi:hypothetical protein